MKKHHPDTILLDHLLTNDYIVTEDGDVINSREELDEELRELCDDCDGTGGHYDESVSDPLAVKDDPQAYVPCLHCDGDGALPFEVLADRNSEELTTVDAERDAEPKRWSKQVDPNKIRERNTATPRECAVRNLMELMDDAGFDFDMQQRVQGIINYELERRGEDLSRKLPNICDEEARKEVRGE